VLDRALLPNVTSITGFDFPTGDSDPNANIPLVDIFDSQSENDMLNGDNGNDIIRGYIRKNDKTNGDRGL